jgi:hypothetical protein
MSLTFSSKVAQIPELRFLVKSEIKYAMKCVLCFVSQTIYGRRTGKAGSAHLHLVIATKISHFNSAPFNRGLQVLNHVMRRRTC